VKAMTSKQIRAKNKQTLDRAIRAYGGYDRVAKELKISRQSVYKWPQAPAGRCKQLEELLGVSRTELRPEIFG